MLKAVKNILWGVPSAAIILLFGAYFTLSLAGRGAFGAGKIKAAASSYLSRGGVGISPLSSLATALGGTVGIGSITGVGLALEVGGPGSMLWFWLCGLLCVGIKYAEVVSAAQNRVRVDGVTVGGAMYSLRAHGYAKMAVVFAAAGALASLGTGNMTQASAVGDMLFDGGIPRQITGAVLAAVVGVAVFGGQKRIADVSSALVPAAGAVYLVMALYAVCINASALPGVFKSIFLSAFGLKQAVGGGMGVAVGTALSVGITRCIFSNEAGMGTSPMAHASAEGVSPSAQGMMGGAEIIADTFVFSTVTALALLAGGTTDVYGLFSAVCGGFGRLLMPVLMAVFAYSAIIAWCFYAESCISFLFPNNKKIAMTVYRAVSVLCVYVGATTSSEVVWNLADILNFTMMVPDLFDLFTKRKEIFKCIGTT